LRYKCVTMARYQWSKVTHTTEHRRISSWLKRRHKRRSTSRCKL
jgi:hypothetical protein